ncbi:7345_t:CDS:2, partial [Gigaspora margarita]
DIGAYFFASIENSDTVGVALKIIRSKLCHWSSRYILSDQSSIEAKEPQDIMIAAMYKRTRIGCEKLIQDAINCSTVPAVQNYIERNYKKIHSSGPCGHDNIPPAFASYLYEPAGILSQRIEKNHVFVLWINRYM